jgi:hypothetical protein
MRPTPAAPVLVFLAVVLASCGGEPLSTDPSVVWAESQAWAPGEAGLLRDDWTYAAAAADSLSPALIERVEAAVAGVEGGLRVLAIAQDGCIDSAHSIPYLAAVAAAVPGLDLRVVHPRVGGALMEAHPTPDGRSATPTVLLLDQLGEVRGCWIERPAAVQYWYMENPEDLGRIEKFAAKTEWYEADRGAHALAEFAHIVEMAAAGSPVCGLPMDSVAELPEPGAGSAGVR